MRPLPIVLACVLAGVLCVAAPRPSATGQAAGSPPSRATVFIRLLGGLEIDPLPDPAVSQALRQRDIELGTGSGFLFSPYGHVLTCAHVVEVEPATATYEGTKVQLKPTLRRIEVLLPDEGDGRPPPAPLEATVIAIDRDLDLAALSVTAAGTPSLHLGDSDAAEGGDPVEAIGYPFGRRLEIARPSMGSDTTPAASISRGHVSASRLNAQGERRYLQTTAALNAGSSGGPILDADGYVLGIANSIFTARNAPTGVGFGIPVNLAKRFLEAHSLDSLLAARSLALGPPGVLEGKGIRLALPHGLADGAPVRSRVDTGGDPREGLVLRVDRIVSPWTPARLAETLVGGQAFEAFSATSAPVQRIVESGGRSLLLGRVAGTMRGGATVRMEYAVVEVGTEKLLARFIGPAHQLAFGASVLRASLRSLEADSLRPAAGRDGALRVSWATRRVARHNPLDRVPVAGGWVEEPVVPYPCRGLPGPADAVSLSPLDDFALALRAAWIRDSGDAVQAASACGGGGEAAYERQVDALGTRYLVVGRFVPVSPGDLLQLEGSAPLDQAARLRAAFADWVARVGVS